MCGDYVNIKKLLYILCFEIIITNSKTSTLWRLNTDKTRIVQANTAPPVISYHQKRLQEYPEDHLFEIIATTEHLGNSWIRQPDKEQCTRCQHDQELVQNKNNATNHTEPPNSNNSHEEVKLDCGKPANFTYYDNLVGVANRHTHPLVPEPQAAFYFTRSFGRDRRELEEFNLEEVERWLKQIKKELPKSMYVFNLIGNYWRIKGDTAKAIECYRKSLSMSPHNPEVLLFLARVLFSLQYLDDAVFLTRRSLEVKSSQSSDKAAWLQYFTLGEIFKSYGHYQEAAIHLKHCLELNPGFEPAIAQLRELESGHNQSLHIYTLVIIVCLVLGVLLVILSSFSNTNTMEHIELPRRVYTIRHFHLSTRRCKRSS